MKKVSIIVPAYNEEKRIGHTLELYSPYFEFLNKIGEIDYEILIVINNTTDRTLEIVKSYAKKNKNIRYLDLTKGGKGYAVIEGFKDALKRDNNLIGFVDADCSTKPEAFYDLIVKISKYDGVIASRYLKKSIVEPKQTLARIVVSRIFNAYIRALLMMPYRDTQCGAKLFKRNALERTLRKLTMSKWAFDVDLIYSMRKEGLHVEEIPTKWSDKTHAKINFMRAGPWMALGILRLRLLNSPFKSMTRIYDKMLNRVWKLR
ncbi:glycosyltransferase [Candidatus Pacearchaeota archaeon]|nr:glycosyltransferase [Candidatus Pacearchaeota archaeon]